MNSSGVVTTSSTCDTTRLTYISTLNGDVQSQINDIKSGATSVGNSAKATSATSATYSSTANYAKTAAGATTASKATSATSATYSSTANYAKSAPTYKGATTAAAGTKGLVPAASTATKNCFLRGDGQWADPVSTGTDGTIRYDQSDDWIKVYFNGSWSNWKKAGLLWDFYLYKDGNPYYEMYEPIRVPGEDGVELLLKNTDAETMWDKLLELGKVYDIKPIGLGARDTLRLEAALHLYGNDLDENPTPIEAGLSWSIPKDKVEYYNGKEVIENQLANGTEKKLIAFKMIDKGIARHGYDVYYNNEKVVGGKAYNLHILTSNGINVPKWFAVTSADAEFSVDEEKLYAVRSSAVGEDGSGNSFAGQMESYL